jgi:signal transduction histidine kinase
LQGSQAVVALLDPLRTEQVMVNLLDNAAKFSPHDAPVEVELALVGEDEARISVRDHGNGLAGEDRERVFERFYQARPNGEHGGLGLGLYISRQIVQMHGGTLACEAAEGEGNRFVLRLPLRGRHGESSATLTAG